MNAEADSTLSKKLVGRIIRDLTWGGYAGDTDWDKKVEILELVTYPRPKPKDDEGHIKKGWPIQRVENRE